MGELQRELTFWTAWAFFSLGTSITKCNSDDVAGG